ncbi:TonB-dependent receptor [Sphingomonas cannabina]|uniref:TonB-dependent receptor n=1 Tax=Sphingomonas cannabina TaxID=2899123 RepID=UPI001F252B01|nr:TonB-dependent receptor [Sphingomonas cannabina]UIJ47277.1 TonB-dependent receptor [Sphingomonas cannabina]
MRITALLLTASTLALAAPAFAQEAPAAADDIVVTAQLVEQRPIEVPFALTAYTGGFLDDQGIEDFERLAQYVPGFNVQNQSPNNPALSIRGITSDSGESFTEPRVSVFQDGVSISRSRGAYVELFDLERVEVSKGPQSTLYGRGALIGAVNIVQAKADPDAAYGYGYGQYTNLGGYRLDGTMNVPLSDTLAVRIAGRVKKRDGYVDNLLGARDFNSQDTEAVRGSIRFAPERLTIDVIANYQHDAPAGTAFKSIAYNPTDPVTGQVIGDRGRNSGAALMAPASFVAREGQDLGLERDVGGITGLVNYELTDALSLNGVVGWRRFHSKEVFDADGISLPILTAAEDAEGKQTQATLRLTYDNDGAFTGFVGATWFKESGQTRVPLQFDERVALARLAGVLNGPIPGRATTDPAPLAAFANTQFTGALLQGVLANLAGITPAQAAALLPTAQARAIAANLGTGFVESTTNYNETESFDVFADGKLKLGDRFEIGGGIRYTHDSKTTGIASAVLNGRSILGGFIGALSQPAAVRTQLLQALAVPGAANIPQSAQYPVPMFAISGQPTAGNGAIVSQDLKTDGLTWRATARYMPSEDASLYFTYARGRRPELLSPRPPSAPFAAPVFTKVDAETVDSFEGGVKTALLDRKLSLDAAVFYYKYNNFQTTEQVGTAFVVTNAGKAESYGFEGQFRWAAAGWVDLFGTYAYNHGRLKSGIYDGNHFRLSPDHAASFGIEVKAPVGPVRVDFSPSVTYQSKVFFDDNNDIPALQQPPRALVADNIQDEFQDGYALVNARIGIERPEAGWRIEAFATNLFGKDYIKDAGNSGDNLGLPTFIAGEPRIYGVALSIKTGRR